MMRNKYSFEEAAYKNTGRPVYRPDKRKRNAIRQAKRQAIPWVYPEYKGHRS